MTKLAVLTDLHANLPALRAVLAAIEKEGCDLVVHTGDAIAIGPHPAECLDLLLNIPDVVCLKGNHEAWLVDGLPQPRPDWMTDGEVAHQHWTHAQIDMGTRAAIDLWPYRLALELGGVRVTFVHYALTESGQVFVPVVRPPTAEGLDRVFSDEPAAVIYYGHDHRASDIEGRARYVSPGSIGCWTEALARYDIVEFGQGLYALSHHSVPYDDTELYRAFEDRHVPERASLYGAFFGGRWG